MRLGGTTARGSGRPGRRRGTRPPGRATGAIILLLATASCDIEWGGARVALEDPAPPRPAREEPESSEAGAIPLPSGPFLYLVRSAGARGALVTPLAALPPGGGSPAGLELPDPLPQEFRARFDSVFLRPGSELTLQRWGGRIGTVVIGETLGSRDPACASVVRGTVLLLPGQSLPSTTIALPPGLSTAAPELAPSLEPVGGMTVAAPVIAERLIGGDRAFLAQRVSLQAVRLPGDTAPAMAVTYLIDDSLAVGPPGSDAVSLFFLSGPDPSRGYVTRWSELRRYDEATEKEAFEYLDWVSMPAGRLHVLRMYGGSSVRLAAAFLPSDAETDADRQVTWREAERCAALARLARG